MTKEDFYKKIDELSCKIYDYDTNPLEKEELLQQLETLCYIYFEQ